MHPFVRTMMTASAMAALAFLTTLAAAAPLAPRAEDTQAPAAADHLATSDVQATLRRQEREADNDEHANKVKKRQTVQFGYGLGSAGNFANSGARMSPPKDDLLASTARFIKYYMDKDVKDIPASFKSDFFKRFHSGLGWGPGYRGDGLAPDGRR